MGTWWRAHDIAGLIKALPDGALLCLDEAYCEFAPPEALAPLDVDNPQVLRFRTFSKAYGLAGARIGYAIGEAGLIKSLRQDPQPFRRQPHRPGRRAGRAFDETHLAKSSPRLPRRARRSQGSRRQTGSKPCRRAPISSPSTAAATAISPAGCCRA
jgi:histidinol-phosphate aminotransferase